MRRLPLLIAGIALPLSAAQADEGMWTFDAFPAATLKAEYDWPPP